MARIIYNGEDVAEVNPNGMTYKTPPLAENSVIYIYFEQASQNPESIRIYQEQQIVSYGEDILYFGKLYTEYAPEEFGVLISKKPEVSEDDEETEKVKARFLPEEKTGSFGFRLKNSTQDESTVIYLRPYAIYNGVMNLGETVKIDWDSVKGIFKENTVQGWLENNGLNYSGIMDYVLEE